MFYRTRVDISVVYAVTWALLLPFGLRSHKRSNCTKLSSFCGKRMPSLPPLTILLLHCEKQSTHKAQAVNFITLTREQDTPLSRGSIVSSETLYSTSAGCNSAIYLLFYLFYDWSRDEEQNCLKTIWTKLFKPLQQNFLNAFLMLVSHRNFCSEIPLTLWQENFTLKSLWASHGELSELPHRFSYFWTLAEIFN